ncbi:hypothetical protein [Dokdonella sp.]|uniref:hypothetical protein n=1 Tax=Dokdonella sp. TaxID=2291710 RepID=UPI002F3EC7C6
MRLQTFLRGRSVLRWLAELALVSAGVFLALLADQWRESREHRQLAADALRNFAEEMRVNRKAVADVRAYHERLARGVGEFLAAEGPRPMERFQAATGFRGVQPVMFEHTAWDLALATQALAYLPQDLAYSISRIYTRQQTFQTYENSFAQGMFGPLTFQHDDTGALARSMQVYLTDVNIQEPGLLQAYDAVLPMVGVAP